MFLSNPGTAVAFYIGFCFLRERTSGMHAKTIAGCFILSLLFEYIFIGILFRRLSIGWIIFIAIISSIVIYLYAPYNHPNMGFSTEERRICSCKARIRLLVIVLLAILCFLLGQHPITSGLCLSIAMAAFLLAFAYITKLGGSNNEHKRVQSKKTAEDNCDSSSR
jgi:accessory gene regulator protein AgrB